MGKYIIKILRTIIGLPIVILLLIFFTGALGAFVFLDIIIYGNIKFSISLVKEYPLWPHKFIKKVWEVDNA